MSDRILIIESDDDLRQRLYRRFLTVNVFVDVASTSCTALRRLEEERYAVILLDLGMPGIEASYAAIAESQHDALVIGTATSEVARTIESDVVQMIVRRPLRVKELVEMIRSCIESATAIPARPALQPNIVPGS